MEKSKITTVRFPISILEEIEKARINHSEFATFSEMIKILVKKGLDSIKNNK